ncbi:MAG TPA: DUF4097 family beta strand repeat-containing protein [Anaerolineaceae bacterium]
MSTMDQTWPAEPLRAVSIWVPGSRVRITGVDGDQVRLLGGSGPWYPDGLQPVVSGEWLVIQAWEDSPVLDDLTISLPRGKAWVVELNTWNGSAEVTGLQGRFFIAAGRGDIRVADCRGMFSLRTGDGNIDMESCTEETVPERPPSPPNMGAFAQSSDLGDLTIPGPQDWMKWETQDWNAWGMQFGGHARRWAQQFSQFWNQVNWFPMKAGFNLSTGKGNARLRRIETSRLSMHTAKGDVRLEEGAVASLLASSSHGDIEVTGVLPGQAWEMKTSHGDILLTLPADAQARLDAATRHGDLRSEVALVRVARPGPESRGGGRMVGTLGPSEGARAQVSLVTQDGDITVRLGPASQRSPDPAQAVSEPVPAAAAEPQPAVEPESREGAAGPGGVVETAARESAPESPEVPPAAPEPAEDPIMAVLQALRDGSITVEEADRLLQNQIGAGPSASGNPPSARPRRPFFMPWASPK